MVIELLLDRLHTFKNGTTRWGLGATNINTFEDGLVVSFKYQAFAANTVTTKRKKVFRPNGN